MLGQGYSQSKYFRRVSRSKVSAVIYAATISLIACEQSQGLTGSWIGPAVAASLGGDNTWSTPGNWDTVPGNNLGSSGTSADIVNLSGNPVEGGIVVDLNRNIAGVNFDTTSKALSIGTPANPNPGPNGYADIPAQPALYLTGGGTSQNVTTSTAGANADFYSPLLINGNSYTFTNATTGTPGLRIRNTVAPAPGVNGVVSLTIDGTQGSTSSSNSELHGPMSDSATAILSVVKSGTGCWEMNQGTNHPNTYSGDTIINGGAIRTTSGSGDNGFGGLSANSNYIINNSGFLRIGGTNNSVKSITINPGGTFSSNSSSTNLVTATTTSGPSVTLNYNNPAIAGANINMFLSMAGTTPMQGGFKFVGNSNISTVDFGGGGINLGTVLRPFDIGPGATANTTTPGDFDLRFNGAISGGSATGGLVKTGTGFVRFGNAANSFAGKLEIQAGTVSFTGGDNALSGNPDLVINGGGLLVAGTTGAIQTVNTVTITKGWITRASSLSTVKANSFLLNVAAPDTATASAILADVTSGAIVTKNGAGTAILSGANSYTGVTRLNAGTLILIGDPAQNQVLTGPGGRINAGTLVIDWAGGTDRSTAVKIAASDGHLSPDVADPARAIGWITDAPAGKTFARHVYRGDANLDGKVNALDFNALASSFGVGNIWAQGDFNYDGAVNNDDFTALSLNFNLSLSAAPLPSPEAASLGTLVPEPSTMTLAALGAALAARRRR